MKLTRQQLLTVPCRKRPDVLDCLYAHCCRQRRQQARRVSAGLLVTDAGERNPPRPYSLSQESRRNGKKLRCLPDCHPVGCSAFNAPFRHSSPLRRGRSPPAIRLELAGRISVSSSRSSCKARAGCVHISAGTRCSCGYNEPPQRWSSTSFPRASEKPRIRVGNQTRELHVSVPRSCDHSVGEGRTATITEARFFQQGSVTFFGEVLLLAPGRVAANEHLQVLRGEPRPSVCASNQGGHVLIAGLACSTSHFVNEVAYHIRGRFFFRTPQV